MYYSFIMFKPDCLERQLVLEILERLKVQGIAVEALDYRLVTQEKIFEHYAHVIAELGETFKEMATNSFAGKYVIPIIISSKDENIIADVRRAIGATDPAKAAPGTIRGDFGNDSTAKANLEHRCCNNLIHASDSKEAYMAECELWFGKELSGKYI
jgi:nucleoside-diphosphate kinase